MAGPISVFSTSFPFPLFYFKWKAIRCSRKRNTDQEGEGKCFKSRSKGGDKNRIMGLETTWIEMDRCTVLYYLLSMPPFT